MRVLIVDDYPGAADMSCVLVRMFGHEARGARSGVEALDLVIAFKPDVILLDLGLPDLDGHEVARRVRERSGVQPFIAAMTGWDHPAERAKSFASGFDMHVVKPANEESLRKTLDAAQAWLYARDE